jgi:hypothetical protein
MRQVIRKSLQDIIVDEVRLKEPADNPSEIRTVLDVMKTAGPVATTREFLAKFSQYGAIQAGKYVFVEKPMALREIDLHSVMG